MYVQPQPMIVTAPMHVACYGPYPTSTQCPHCHSMVTTRVEHVLGSYFWIMFALLFFFGWYIGLCLIPLCCQNCKDAEHSCPACNNRLGYYKR